MECYSYFYPRRIQELKMANKKLIMKKAMVCTYVLTSVMIIIVIDFTKNEHLLNEESKNQVINGKK